MYFENEINPLIKKINSEYNDFCKEINDIGVLSKRDQKFMKSVLDIEKSIAIQKLSEVLNFSSSRDLHKFDSERSMYSRYTDGKKLLEEHYKKRFEDYKKLLDVDALCIKLATQKDEILKKKVKEG